MQQRMPLTRRAVVVLSVLLAAGQTSSAGAYQTYGITVGGRVISIKWSHLPVRYYVTDRGVPGVTSSQFRDAAGRAFATWQAAPTASVSAAFVGFTSANAGDDDGRNVLGFLSRPDLDRVLGATDYLIDDSTGEIVESDIFFNSGFSWSVAAAGEPGKYDLESIILHETGHLFGLGHSALGETELRSGGRRVIAAESVLFPIAFSSGSVNDRVLRADDIAGLSEVYPSASAGGTGSMSGRVTKSGQGVLGAHVVAFNPKTGKLVGNLTVDRQGNFSMFGLDPGPCIVRVEPLDDADLDSFFDDAQIPSVDLNFRVAYHPQFVVVPRGGGAQPIEVKVIAK